MVDWAGMGKTALWVLGLAIILATWSWNEWWARVHKRSLRSVLGEARFQVPLSIGLFVFCVGMALSENTLWKTAVWAVLALLFAWQGVQTWRSRHAHLTDDER
jgi:threonine/homoserine/homoserine lactone efflux protein